jgi:hypothetical protein
MQCTLQSVIDGLQAFVPSTKDNNVQALYQIFDGFNQLADRRLAAAAMFNVMERFPEADLGSPGPIVHHLESIGEYESLLVESLVRKPTMLTTWMANRILNSKSDLVEREFWLTMLTNVTNNRFASEETQESAHMFIDGHLGRSY